MEAVVRHLRDGAIKEDGSCPLALLCDQLGCAGGQDILQQLLEQYAAGVVKGVCQAQHIKALQLDGSLHLPHLQSCLSLLDGWSDPSGWLRHAGIQPNTAHQQVTITGPQALNTLLEALTTRVPNLGQANNVCVVIDNLAPLLLHQQPAKVLWWMEQLRTHPMVSCIVLSVQQAVVGPGVSSALQRMASCVISLDPISSLQQEVLRKITPHTPHGACTCAFKSRRAGVSFFSAPAELAHLMTPEALVALSVKAKQAPPAPSNVQAPADAPAKQSTLQGTGDSAAAPLDVAGSMRLTLTDEERLAKQAVVLPYEHKGAGAAYQTGDWKDYLPVAAGGRAALSNHVSQTALAGASQAGGQLGQILYVRDSDDEDGGLHDSDEDPDDDLDI